jgi:signal peptidase I
MSPDDQRTVTPGGLPDTGQGRSPAGPVPPQVVVPPTSVVRDRKKEKKPRTLTRTVIEIVVIVAAAFALAMLVQAFIVKPFTIHQISMEPTLHEGDRILISRLSYHFRDPKAGDVVVFHSPVEADEDLVKRVVAVPGDTVAIRDGDLFVNGRAVNEPYLLEQDFRGEYPERVILEGEVFVLGDNRNNSGDSRLFGPIDVDLLIGSAFAIYWPIGRWGGV